MTTPIGFVVDVQDRGAQRLLAALNSQLAALTAAQRQNIAAANAQADAFGRFRNQLVGLFAAFEGARAFKTFIAEGLKFNQVIESATLGIASLITAETKLFDQNGVMLTGTRALNAAYSVSTDQLNKLRIAGLQTAATTEQLVDAFQQAVASGLSAGLTLDQVRKTTIQIVQAAIAIGLPMNQLNQEVRSILDATIDRNSRVAKILDITNQDVRLAKEQGRLQEFLNSKLQAFTVAGEKAAQTMQVLKSNLVEAFQVFSGAATEPLFEQLRLAGLKALEGVFDFRQARVSEAFQGLLQSFQGVFGELGSLLSDAIEGAVGGAQRLSDWLAKNRVEVQATAKAFFDLIRSVAQVTGSIASIVAGMIRWSTEAGLIRAAFLGIKGVVDFIREHPVLTGGIFAGVAAVANVNALIIAVRTLTAATIASNAAAAVNPWLLAVAAIAALGFAIDSVRGKRERELIAQQQQIEKTTEEVTQSIRLAAEYERLQRAINSGKLSRDELVESQNRQREIIDELVKLNPKYQTAIQTATTLHKSLAEAIGDETRQRALAIKQAAVQAALALDQAERELAAARKAQEEELRKRKPGAEAAKDISLFGTEEAIQSQAAGSRVVSGAIKNLKDYQAAVDNARKQVDLLRGSLEAVAKAERQSVFPTIVPPKARVDPGKVVNDLKQITQAEIEKIKEHLRVVQADLDLQLAEAKISYAKYFADLTAAQLQAVDAQIAQLKILKSGLTDKGDLAKAQADIDALEESKERIRDDNNRKRIAKEKELANEVTAIRVRVLEDEGKNLEAASVRLEAEFRELIARLQAEGRTADIDLVRRLIDLEKFKVIKNQLENELGKLQDDMDRNLANIEARRISGALTESQARLAVVDVYRENIDILEKVKEAYSLLGAQIGDKALQEGLKQIQQAIDALKPGLEQAVEATHELRKAFSQAIQSDIANFLNDEILRVHGLADAFAKLALSVVSSIRRIINEIIAYKIVAAVFGAFGVSIGPGPFGIGGKAKGGYIASGPPGIDTVPTMLTVGEYVLNARVTKQIGKEQLDAWNFGRELPEKRSPVTVSKGVLQTPQTVTQKIVAPAWIVVRDYVLREKSVSEVAKDQIRESNVERDRDSSKETVATIARETTKQVVATTVREMLRDRLRESDRAREKSSTWNVERTFMAAREYVMSERMLSTQTRELVSEIWRVIHGQTIKIPYLQPIYRASGGHISSGPRGIDKVPAMLTVGEYVLNAATTNRIGVDRLDEWNFGYSAPRKRRRFFNEGGLVEQVPEMSVNVRGETVLRVQHTPNYVIDVMKSHDGQRVQVETVGKKREQFRGALGV